MYLAKNRLNCVEMLISYSIKYENIDHSEFSAIMKEKKDYDRQKNEGDKNKIRSIEIV